MRDVARSFAADASSASSSADASAVTGAVVDRARARGDRARVGGETGADGSGGGTGREREDAGVDGTLARDVADAQVLFR